VTGSDVQVEPGGDFAYVSSPFESALLVLARDPATGQPSHVETHADGVAGDSGIAHARGVVVDPLGHWVTGVRAAPGVWGGDCRFPSRD